MSPTIALVTLLLAAAPQRGPDVSGAPGATPAPPSRALLRELTAQPRLAGTVGSKVGAEIVRRRLVAAGFEVELDERAVLLSYPRSVELALFEGPATDGDASRASRPERAEKPLASRPQRAEKPLASRIERFDPDAIPPGDVPKYNAWAKSGSLRAPVVDAGYGTRADFERLKALGVELDGTIALVRYGRAYRGIKVDLAAQYGCGGVLLFTDPATDGAAKGPTWPAGPWKPDWDAQRGSILSLAHVPGDPSTPGWASGAPGEDVKRIAGEQLDDALPTIPCLPIGAKEATMLLERLAVVRTTKKTIVDGVEREVAGEERLGPGPVEARIALEMPREMRTIVNVIARLAGATERLVIAGAHRDAWVRGANDDGAGVTAIVRAAEHLGERARAGWKPDATIVLAFWDAEEFGLLGSTEWGEAHADLLRANAVAYVNSDVGVSGPRFVGAGGSPGLLGVLKRVLERIPAAPRADGATPASLWEEWRATLRERAREGQAPDEPSLGLPGSGSDFAVFAHHLSIPVIEPSFGGGQGGQYHTSFDDFEMVERYVDPGFVGHELLARVLAELLVEIADAPSSAFDPREAALALKDVATKEKERAAGELAHALAEVVGALQGLADAANAHGGPDGPDSPAMQRRRELRTRFYRALELPEGLPGRPWFKNALWAPGLEDGYGSETFPTLRAAAARGDAELARERAALVERIRRAGTAD